MIVVIVVMGNSVALQRFQGFNQRPSFSCYGVIFEIVTILMRVSLAHKLTTLDFLLHSMFHWLNIVLR